MVQDPSGSADGRRDAVGTARDAWRRRGLGDSEEAFLAMSSVLRLQRLVTGAVEAALKGVKLHLTDYMLLMTLELSPDGAELISGVARALLVHPTTATLAADRLEERGLLARTQHPTDRRATRLTITGAGAAAVRAATEALAARDFGLVGSRPDDRADLVELISRIRADVGDDR